MDIDDVKVGRVHGIAERRIQDLTEHRAYQNEYKRELNKSEWETYERGITKANTPTMKEPTRTRQPRINPVIVAPNPRTAPIIQQEKTNRERVCKR